MADPVEGIYGDLGDLLGGPERATDTPGFDPSLLSDGDLNELTDLFTLAQGGTPDIPHGVEPDAPWDLDRLTPRQQRRWLILIERARPPGELNVLGMPEEEWREGLREIREAERGT